MTLNLRECAFVGPALPAPFVRFELEAVLAKRHVGEDAKYPTVCERCSVVLKEIVAEERAS